MEAGCSKNSDNENRYLMTTPKFINLLPVLLLITPGSLLANGPEQVGTVCVTPVPKPTAGGKSLSNPSDGNKVRSYSVQIGNKPIVTPEAGKSVAVDRLSLGQQHLVKIMGDGRPVTSFRFRFETYKSERLCLVFSPLYETWSMRAAASGGPGCTCR
jgi:hypothetical protein